jgi:hypothetical protein
MRIALQISGDFRVLQHSFEKLIRNTFFDPESKVDIFIHTWKRETTSAGTFLVKERGDWNKSMLVFSHTDGINLFKPVSYLVEDFSTLTHLHKYPRCMPMWYSIFQANRIRKEYEIKMNIKYDLVIRYRTDCILEENIFNDSKEIINSKKDFLCIPKSSRVLCEFEETLCDWFAFGTPSMMDIYCSIYEKWVGAPVDMFPIPEVMLFQKVYGITLERPLIDFYLIEGDGSRRGILLSSMT